MKIERTSQVNFGARPKLIVLKKNEKLFNEVADKFDKYNQKLKRKLNEVSIYEISQDKNGLSFVEYKDDWRHSIDFDRKLTEEFLKKPADYIAKTFAKAAEVFALDDKLWFKTSRFVNSILNNKQLKMTNENQCEFEDLLNGEMYNKYILTTMKNNLKENEFLAKAKIEL